MARKKSSIETDYWLIPKRSSIHQVWCLIDGIKERGVNGRVWNPTLQNDLGVNLKKWGATNSGRNISPQAMRTLNAFAQYLGFIYVDNTCTPSVIRITKAGDLFWLNAKPYIQKLRNLKEDKNKSLQISSDVKFQLEKLQLTNPIEEKKCTNILLFPFRITLRLLLDLEYLDLEELAMYVFNMKEETDYVYTKSQIENFRKISSENRRSLVDAFKKTLLGNLSLVQAPSTSYYVSICEKTGLIYKQEEIVNNSSNKITTMRLRNDMYKYVEDILSVKYTNVLPYNFENNLRLWIEYYGNPDRINTPIDAIVVNCTKEKLLVSVYDSSDYVTTTKLLNPQDILSFPAFKGDNYNLRIFSILQRRSLQDIQFTPTKDCKNLRLEESVTNFCKIEDFECIKQKILEHIEVKNFSGDMAQLLKFLKLQHGIDREHDSTLRGAYLESLFYELLKLMESEGKISDLRWNGKYNNIGLPIPAPGGKNGVPDITFEVKGMVFVLELTTMKAKTMQERAECTSVPDHIRLTSIKSNLPVKGIFAAPIIHERITNMMKATAKHNRNNIGCIKIENLLNLLSVNSETELIQNLNRI